MATGSYAAAGGRWLIETEPVQKPHGRLICFTGGNNHGGPFKFKYVVKTCRHVPRDYRGRARVLIATSAAEL